MKNEDLYVYKKSDFYEDFISSQKEYYEREQVDTLLAEKDREIALLKERICNGDVSRVTWIDACLDKDKEIAELKQTIDKLVGVKKSAEQILKNLLDCGLIKEWYFNGKFNAVLSADDPHLKIAELKDRLDAANNQCENLINSATDIMLRQDKANDAKRDEIESLKATHYAEMVDAGMRERRLKRALWIVRAEMCHRFDVDRYLRNHRNSWYNENFLTWADACVAMEVKMCKVESKCRAKAEEYK